jgi:hypothetical protein
MTTVSAFNDTLDQFVAELVDTFPEEKTFKKYQLSLEIIRKTNARQSLNTFMSSVKSFSDKIMNRDDSFFLEDATKIEFLSDLNICKIWTPDLSVNTKNAIWQYLQTLYLLGATISALPQDALSMIEDVAKKCVENVDIDQISSLIGVLGKNPPKI